MTMSSNCMAIASTLDNFDDLEAEAYRLAQDGNPDNSHYLTALAKAITALTQDIESTSTQLGVTNESRPSKDASQSTTQSKAVGSEEQTTLDGRGSETSSGESGTESSTKDSAKVDLGFPVSPEGTATNDRNRIGDHVRQGKPTLVTTVEGLFSRLVQAKLSSFTSWIADRAGGTALTDNEVSALHNFQEFAKKANEVMSKLHYGQGFFPNRLIADARKDKTGRTDLFEGDLFQQLLTEQNEVKTLSEPVKAALVYSAYQAAIGMATQKLPTKEYLAQLLGIKEWDVDHQVYQAWKDKVLGINTAYNQWGSTAYSALGLTTTEEHSPNVVANFKTALGGQVYQLLRAMDVVQVTYADEASVALLPDTAPLKQSTGRKFFYKIKESPFVESMVTASKGNGQLITKLFETDSAASAPSTKPIKKVPTVTKTGMKVPGVLRRIVGSMQSTPWLIKSNQFDLLNELGDLAYGDITVAERLIGAETDEQIQRKHFTQRDGAKASSESLQVQLGYLKEAAESLPDGAAFTTGMYLKSAIWKMLRIGGDSTIDPTGSKVHRYMLKHKSWDATIAFNDTEMVESFKLRVAEGLGLPTDKKANESNLAKFESLVKEPAIAAAIKTLQQRLANNTAMDGEAIVQAIDAIGLDGGERVKTFDALVEYAKYANAVAAYEESVKAGTPVAATFTTDIMGEVDGVSNGPMLNHLMQGVTFNGLSMEEMFAKGGFYTNDTENYNVWREQPGNADFYEEGSKVLSQVGAQLKASFGKKVPPMYRAMEYFLGSNFLSRKNIKEMFNPLTFGSSTKSAVDGLFAKLIDSVYDRIAEVHAMEDSKEKSTAVASLVRAIQAMGVLVPEDVSIDSLQNSFYFSRTDLKVANSRYSDVFGESFKDALESAFGDFRANNALVTAVTAQAAKFYQSLRNKLIRDAQEAVGIAYDANNITVGLSEEVLAGIDQQLMDIGVKPVMQSMYSQESGELSAGLLLLKSANGTSNDPSYLGTLTGSQPFTTGFNKHVVGHSTQTLLNAPGVLPVSVGVHSGDSYISMRRMADLQKQGIASFNMHDAGGVGLAHMKEMAQSLNRNTFDLVKGYSPMQATVDMALRSLDGLMTYAKTNAKVANAAKQFAMDTLALQQATVTGTADKLQYLSTLTHVSQYALEGGSYAVTDKDRADVQQELVTAATKANEQKAKLEKLISDLTELAKAKDTAEALDATEPVVEEESVEVTPDTDVVEESSVQTEATKPVTTTFKELFAKAGKGLPEYLKVLSNALSNTTKGLPVTLVQSIQDIPVLVHRDAIERLYGTEAKLKGVFLDGHMYIIGNAKDVDVETLMHEAVHATITGYLDAIATGKVTTPEALETYKLLNDLYVSVKAQLSAKLTPENYAKYADVLENLDEFVTYGLTSQKFQQILNTLVIDKDSSKAKAYYAKTPFLRFLQLAADAFKHAVSWSKGVDMRRTKELNNALFGLLAQGSKLMDQAYVANQASSQVRAMKSSTTGLYTYSTLELFDGLADSNIPLNTATEARLKGLLTTIVDGVVGTLDTSTMFDTPLDEKATFQAAMAKGDLPIATAISHAGLAMSEQESFAVDQVAISLEGMLNQLSMFGFRRTLEKLYVQAQREITPASFHGANATAIEQQEAADLHKFIFNSAQTNGQALIRFAAFGLASEKVSTALGAIATKLPEVKLKNTLFSRLTGFFTAVVNFFINRNTGVSDLYSLDTNLQRLVKNLVASEQQRKEGLLTTKKFSAVQEMIDKGAKTVTSQVAKAATSGFVQNNPIRHVPVIGAPAAGLLGVAGKITDASINGRLTAMAEAGMSIRNTKYPDRFGIVAGVVNEVMGETASNSWFTSMLRMVVDTQATREKFIERDQNLINEMFGNASELTKDDRAALTQLLRTGIAGTAYTPAQIQDYLANPASVKAEIDSLIQRIQAIAGKHTDFIRYKSEALGLFTVTGVSKDKTRLAMNATMIARLLGSPHQNDLAAQEAQLVPLINDLVSLYGVSSLNQADTTSLLKTLAVELPRGSDNGVAFTLAMHKKLLGESLTDLFKGNPTQMVHGYVPQVVSPRVDVVYLQATGTKTLAQQEEMYLKAGYKSYGLLPMEQIQGSSPTLMMVNHNLPETRRLTGLFSYISKGTKGNTLHDGDTTGVFAPLNQSMNKRAMDLAKSNYALLKRSGFVLDKSTNTAQMVPVVDEQGNVTNLRHVGSHMFNDDVLKRNNDFARLLGKMHGTTYEKVTSTQQNAVITKALFDVYTNTYKGHENDFMLVGPNAVSDEYKKAYYQLTEEHRREIRKVWGSADMFVRKDMLDMVFGYKKLTAGDAMLQSKADQNMFTRSLVGLFEFLYATGGTPAQKQAARLKGSVMMKRIQRGAEELVGEAKDIIVIRTGTVLMGNETSNLSALFLNGLGLVEALREKGKALSALNVYREQALELYTLETHLMTGTRSNEHPEFIKRIGLLEESMNNNPVKVLIDAGFNPTIVEDVDTESEDYSYRGDIKRRIVDATKSGGMQVIGAMAENLYMSESTGLYQTLRYATQVSDFTARYALYQHLVKKGELNQEQIFQKISSTFVMYENPSHRVLDALNSVGAVMFTKYTLRILKPLYESMRDNPSRALMVWLLGNLTTGIDVITDSTIGNKLYLPTKSGPLEYLGVLDDLLTVETIFDTGSSFQMK